MITQAASHLPQPRIHSPIDHPGITYSDGDVPTEEQIAATRPDFVDISHHQGAIDWDAYKLSGRTGAIIKATEGGDWVDTRFAAHRKDLADRGLKCGFYHFARPNGKDMVADANVEANNFLTQLGTMSANEFPVLDFEVSNSLTPQQLGQWAAHFMSVVAERTGKTPWFYSYSAMVKKVDCSELTKYPLWLANYQSSDKEKPPSSAPWSSMVAWQYTDRSNVEGINGKVDGNYMYGGWPESNPPAQQPVPPAPPAQPAPPAGQA